MKSGKVIQLLRISLDVPASEISESCGISPCTLAKIESNAFPITQSLLEYFALKLSLPISFLQHIFSERGSENKIYGCFRNYILKFLGFYLSVSLWMAPNNENKKILPN